MDVAVFPYLYAIALVAVAWFLVWPRPRLTLTTYYLSVFSLYHGPAFFTYHLESGFQPVFETLAAVLLLSLICFAAGQWLAEPTGRTAAASMRWLGRRAEDDRFATDILWATVAVVGFVAAVNFVAYGATGRLVTGFSLTEADLLDGEYRRLRAEAVSPDMQGMFPVAFTYLCRHGPGPFLALLLFARARQAPAKFRLLLALGLGGLVVLSKLSSLTKSDGIYFVGQATLVWFLASPVPVRMNWRAVAAIGFVFVGLIAVYRRFTTADDTLHAMTLIWHRVTDVPNLCLARYFEFFPNVYDHTCGLNIRLIHGMLQWGDTYVPAHRLIDDNGANANAIYVADAWVDFSWAGVALASLLVGWTLGRLDAGLFARRSPLNVALFVALMAPVHALVSMSLITCFVGYGLVTLPWFARLLRLAEVGRSAAVTTAFTSESRAAIQVS